MKDDDEEMMEIIDFLNEETKKNGVGSVILDDSVMLQFSLPFLRNALAQAVAAGRENIIVIVKHREAEEPIAKQKEYIQ